MDLQENAKIQNAIADHLASGKYSSAEEVVLVALEHLASEDAEHEACLVDMQESIADEKAGRVKEAGTVFADIRAKHDFSDPA